MLCRFCSRQAPRRARSNSRALVVDRVSKSFAVDKTKRGFRIAGSSPVGSGVSRESCPPVDGLAVASAPVAPQPCAKADDHKQSSRVTRSVLRGPFDPLPIVRVELKFRGSHILLEMLKR